MRIIIRFCVDIAKFYGEIFRGRNWQLSAKRYILIHSFHLVAFAVVVEILRTGQLRWEPLMVLFSMVMIAGFGVVIEWWNKRVPHENYNQPYRERIEDNSDPEQTQTADENNTNYYQ